MKSKEYHQEPGEQMLGSGKTPKEDKQPVPLNDQTDHGFHAFEIFRNLEPSLLC
jgi:hypothetical protein